MEIYIAVDYMIATTQKTNLYTEMSIQATTMMIGIKIIWLEKTPPPIV